jgi:hypothetical protein
VELWEVHISTCDICQKIHSEALSIESAYRFLPEQSPQERLTRRIIGQIAPNADDQGRIRNQLSLSTTAQWYRQVAAIAAIFVGSLLLFAPDSPLRFKTVPEKMVQDFIHSPSDPIVDFFKGLRVKLNILSLPGLIENPTLYTERKQASPNIQKRLHSIRSTLGIRSLPERLKAIESRNES